MTGHTLAETEHVAGPANGSLATARVLVTLAGKQLVGKTKEEIKLRVVRS